MEAATPLRQAHVRTFADQLAIDGLVVHDESAVRLVREREEAGDDPVKAVVDAIEIGARVLDREQAGANADFVRGEFDRTAREVETAFAERAEKVAEDLGRKVDEVFGPDSGQLTKALERHFSDDSEAAVQNRVRDVLSELMPQWRESLLKQFSSADAQNPLAEFKTRTVEALREASDRQESNLRKFDERIAAMQVELQKLHDERDKNEEVEAERERGTAKGRTFEEAVAEAVEHIASAQGDDCDAVGDLRGATGKTGDVVVGIDACRGPARGRIVFEAKTGKLSKPEALRELDRGLRERDADFAVLVVPREDKLPARTRPLREYNGDKLFVFFDPEADSPLALEVAYSLARARVLMARSDGEEVDAGAIRDVVERALAVVDDTRKIKSQLTGAKTSIDGARALVEEMEGRVRAHLREIDGLALPGAEAEAVTSEAADPSAEPPLDGATELEQARLVE